MRDKGQNFQGCSGNTFQSITYYTSNGTEVRTMPAMLKIYKVQKMNKIKFGQIVCSQMKDRNYYQKCFIPIKNLYPVREAIKGLE